MANARKDKKHSQSRYGSRKPANKTTLPVLAIVCDDSVAAPKYFRCLRQKLKDVVWLDIVPASCGKTSAGDVVDRAIRKYEVLDSARADDEQVDVWVLIDMEQEGHQRQQAQQAKDRARSNGVSVACSDPCYEVWTLLHLEDTGRSFNGCAAVISRLKQRWQDKFGESFDSKTQIDYAKIIAMRHEACERAKKHREAGDRSWTEVYRIIEAIELLDPQHGSGVA